MLSRQNPPVFCDSVRGQSHDQVVVHGQRFHSATLRNYGLRYLHILLHGTSKTESLKQCEPLHLCTTERELGSENYSTTRFQSLTFHSTMRSSVNYTAKSHMKFHHVPQLYLPILSWHLCCVGRNEIWSSGGLQYLLKHMHCFYCRRGRAEVHHFLAIL